MVFDPQKPVTDGGQLSARALEEMARQAAIPQNQIAIGDYYSTPFGNVIVPQQAESTPAQPGVVVKVTSLTTTDSLYPAVVESCTNVDGNPPVWADGTACWAVGTNDETLAEQRYLGDQIGAHSDGSPVFAVTVGGGESLTVKLDDSSVSVNNVNEIRLNHNDFTESSPGAGITLVGAKGGTVTLNAIVVTGMSCGIDGVDYTTGTLQLVFQDGLFKSGSFG